jgi:hypothetical protein
MHRTNRVRPILLRAPHRGGPAGLRLGAAGTRIESIRVRSSRTSWLGYFARYDGDAYGRSVPDGVDSCRFATRPQGRPGHPPRQDDGCKHICAARRTVPGTFVTPTNRKASLTLAENRRYSDGVEEWGSAPSGGVKAAGSRSLRSASLFEPRLVNRATGDNRSLRGAGHARDSRPARQGYL